MSWPEAWNILEPLTDWPPVRRHKVKALYQLAGEARGGCIVELGTYRGVGAIALALGARDGLGATVYTIDDYCERPGHSSQSYGPTNKEFFLRNVAASGVEPVLVQKDVLGAARAWDEPIALLFEDTGDLDHEVERVVAAWQRHIIPGGVFAQKRFEPKPLPTIPGWRRGDEFPEGLVYTLRNEGAQRRAAFWIVSRGHLAEARVSAASVARTMPELERHLFCDQDPGEGETFTEWHRIAAPRDPWYAELSRYLVDALDLLPERLLYLDSDTYFVDGVPELFELLGRFDLAAAHAPGRETARTASRVPEAFPELNVGMIAMLNNGPVKELWKSVARNLVENFRIYGNNDQAPLREALWNNPEVRLAVLPPEYNCRFQFGAFVTGRVKVLHGRGNYEKVAASINAGSGIRIWRL